MGKRIMVVDDSQILGLEVRRFLEGTDYEVAAFCPNGAAALAEYAVVQPDLVTMDIIMPGMDGLEAARALLAEHPDARIVMMSALAYEDTIDEASAIGAKDFIYKPFDRDLLLTTLERAMAD